MILVADSGSTKTDWVLSDNGVLVAEYNTMGFNPFFHNSQNVLNALTQDAGLAIVKDKITKVKFFGAGCSSVERKLIIENALKSFFAHAEISVEHDMKAAALSTCGNEPGIACILGTGSNICYFDGTTVHEGNHGLGYVLGDEGSGSYFGKKLISYYLYGVMPDDLRKQFKLAFDCNKETVIDKVYNQPNANTYLASFATFLSDHHDHNYIKKLVHLGITDFFETNVCAIAQHKKVPVHFVGSIAYHFDEIIKEVSKNYEVKLGKIIKKPIYDLMRYFVE